LVVSACTGPEADTSVAPITKPPGEVDSCAVTRPDFGAAATQAELSLFAYDVSAPLNLTKTVESTNNGVEVSGISYDSPAGGRVAGVLVNPVNRSGLRPGVILMHGMPSNARALTDQARTLAQYGAVVIAIDAPFVRRTGSGLRMIKQDREEQIQLMKDLQRAVDVLRARPDVDATRIAYMGFSYGGGVGALFAGSERRIKAAGEVRGRRLVTHSSGSRKTPFLGSLFPGRPVAGFCERYPSSRFASCRARSYRCLFAERRPSPRCLSMPRRCSKACAGAQDIRF
jgi:predicted dienelactone hydrolase